MFPSEPRPLGSLLCFRPSPLRAATVRERPMFASEPQPSGSAFRTAFAFTRSKPNSWTVLKQESKNLGGRERIVVWQDPGGILFISN
jgi:hypothetical protein